jgi:hypothetical protein
MDRLLIKAVLKMLIKSLGLTAIIGILIGILGYVNKWDSSITYSNAFFIAGSLLIIAGTSARYAAGQEYFRNQLLSSEGFRGMSSGERALAIINSSSSVRTLIFGLTSGVMLWLISAIIAFLF